MKPMVYISDVLFNISDGITTGVTMEEIMNALNGSEKDMKRFFRPSSSVGKNFLVIPMWEDTEYEKSVIFELVHLDFEKHVAYFMTAKPYTSCTWNLVESRLDRFFHGFPDEVKTHLKEMDRRVLNYDVMEKRRVDIPSISNIVHDANCCYGNDDMMFHSFIPYSSANIYYRETLWTSTPCKNINVSTRFCIDKNGEILVKGNNTSNAVYPVIKFAKDN